MCGWGGGGGADPRLVRVNEFKTNDMQKDVYHTLNPATAFNGSKTDDTIELLSDDEEDSFSTEVIPC